MTHEEAIKAINANYPPREYSTLCEALDLAMKVLEETKEVKESE